MAKNSRVQLSGLLLLVGCTVQGTRPVEYQLDISGAEITDTDRVRICVDGFGMREEAIGSGRLAFTGLEPDTAISVTVDVLQSDAADSGEASEDRRTGRVGPLDLSPESPWRETPWEVCEEACSACQSPGNRVATDADSSILAIRFID